MDVKFFDKKTKKFYKLLTTQTWPTVLVSGIRMHRTDGIDPKTDTWLKIKSLGKIYGNILDTCTGLGYTAIVAAKIKDVKWVLTFEKDKNIISIAKQNLFSRDLFENEKIMLLLCDVSIGIKFLKSEFFDFIIHDPPRFSLSPELYSQEFYNELYRVLKKRGRLFHYTGNPGSKQGKNMVKGMCKRLKIAGFKVVRKVEKASGVVVCKH
ncbi:MAG: MnmC family methyltransferase [Candidatus Aenigmarchaeota archaeon]|nr:MnmC family methyltransferase [Candidatus Aenigmarchaeota archaeon]